MKYRNLVQDDLESIKQLYTRTFSDSEGEAEGQLIGTLVYRIMTSTPSHDYCGYVAIDEKVIVGCIIFSRLWFNNSSNTMLLSPVAVHTDYQGKKIGQNLIRYGLSSLKDSGVEHTVTYGDINFYSKVGFTVLPEDVLKAPFELSYTEGWLGQSLVSDTITPISGRSRCIDAFNDSKLW